MLTDLLELTLDIWRQGGFVMWFLGPVALLMWYGIGVRMCTLRRGVSARDGLSRWSKVVTGAAIVAPLAGLLGTVTGMITTFDALGSAATTGQGGIGSGIAEALVSTQAGLVVAVPGLFVGALLNRRQRQLEDELDQLAAQGGTT